MPPTLLPVLVVCAAVLTPLRAADATLTKTDFAGCFLHPPADSRTSPLSHIVGHNFTAEHEKAKYTVCVCCNATQTDANITVLATPETAGSAPKVYGRRNCSHLAVTDRWILLQFHGGDSYTANESCSHGMPDRRSTVLVITCNSGATETALSVVAADNCSLFLELRTSLTCPAPHALPVAGLSHGSVFCILFLSLAGTYLLVGVCYRRLICGAKGFDQLPNKDFWVNLGHLQADGCNLVCRRGEPPDSGMMSRSDGWQQIAGGSFTDSDRDDAPLQP